MGLLKAVVLISLVATALAANARGRGQRAAEATSSCPTVDLVILADCSENARNAASPSWDTHPFQFLKVALIDFLSDLSDNFNVRIYGYSSRDSQVVTRDNIDDICSMEQAGSWTEAGLHQIQEAPSSEANSIVVLSTQGAARAELTAKAKQEVARVKALGWNVVVIALKGRNNFNMEELKEVNGGKNFVVLDDHQQDPKSFTLLAAELRKIAEGFCPNSE